MHSLFLRLSTFVLACCVLAGCAGLAGPRQVELPLTKLQASMDKRFPLNKRVMEWLDIELSHPQLAVQEGSERLMLSLEATVAPPFSSSSWHGSLVMSGLLVLDAARSGLYLEQARVERFDIDGNDAIRQRLVGKAGNFLLDQLVRDKPLYSFRPDQLRYGDVQFVPAAISTTPRGLLVTLEPVR